MGLGSLKAAKSEAGKNENAKGKRGRVDVSGVASADAGGQMALFKEYVPHPAVDAALEGTEGSWME